MDLFEKQKNIAHEPLAYRMRPKNLDEFFGQNHIVGKGRLLRRVIQADQLSSLIFYGPPGTGKTTLAQVIANSTKSLFITLNAVLAGIADLKKAIDKAKEYKNLYDRRSILFIDEVHRWNKKQQDALLPWVENGTVVLVGATTENPYFEVNSALVSRSRIFQLKPLDDTDLYDIVKQAVKDKERGYGRYAVSIEEQALEHLVHTANGDARSLLNALELAVETSPESFPPADGEKIHISLDIAEESIQRKVVLYDKDGDYHYDTISAFIKSIRGSDPDATLYWLAKMVHAGEEPRFLFRRMLISASEDIGLADPFALGVVEAAAATFDRIGMPEGRFPLAHAALYLATAPKSNSTMGFFDALKAVESEDQGEVPNHLRDGNRDKKGFGHGEGYLYPHAYKDHWVPQQYLPNSLVGKVFFRPCETGYEAKIRDAVERKREVQLSLGLSSSTEVLTNSPQDREKQRWINRALEANADYVIEFIAELYDFLAVQRHESILISGSRIGPAVWEALRRMEEGAVYALFANGEEYSLCESYARHFKEIDRPQFFPLSDAVSWEPVLGSHDIDTLLFFDFVSIKDAAQTALSAVSTAERVVCVRGCPELGSHLSDILLEFLEVKHLKALKEFESAFFNKMAQQNKQMKETVLHEQKLTYQASRTFEYSENRLISKRFLQSWMENQNSQFVQELHALSVYDAVINAAMRWQDSVFHWKLPYHVELWRK